GGNCRRDRCAHWHGEIASLSRPERSGAVGERSAPVTADLHERARMLVALSGPDGISAEEQGWLASHLDSCASCRDFADHSRETIRTLRAFSVTAGSSLVS